MLSKILNYPRAVRLPLAMIICILMSIAWIAVLDNPSNGNFVRWAISTMVSFSYTIILYYGWIKGGNK